MASDLAEAQAEARRRQRQIRQAEREAQADRDAAEAEARAALTAASEVALAVALAAHIARNAPTRPGSAPLVNVNLQQTTEPDTGVSINVGDVAVSLTPADNQLQTSRCMPDHASLAFELVSVNQCRPTETNPSNSPKIPTSEG